MKHRRKNLESRGFGNFCLAYIGASVIPKGPKGLRLTASRIQLTNSESWTQSNSASKRSMTDRMVETRLWMDRHFMLCQASKPICQETSRYTRTKGFDCPCQPKSTFSVVVDILRKIHGDIIHTTSTLQSDFNICHSPVIEELASSTFFFGKVMASVWVP